MEKLNSVSRTAVRWNVVLQILAMVVLVGAANYYSFNHYARWDFSRSQKFTLADQSRRVWSGNQLKKPVRIMVYFSPTSATPETVLFPDVQNLLKELVFASRLDGRPRVEVEYIDPVRDLSRARELQGRYKFSGSENVVILDYGGQVQFVPVAEMGEFDLSPMAGGEPPRLIAFSGEQAMTNALISVLSPEKRTVYFLQGHGEPGTDGTTPLSLFKEYVEKQNAAVRPLTLAGADTIPKDSAALVLVAPQYDLDEREAAILEKYWKESGRFLVLLDPDADTPNLRHFLREKGILPRNDRVLRTIKQLTFTGIWRHVTGEFLPNNLVTKRLVGATILLPGQTQSLALDEGGARAKQIQLRPLIVAAEEYWGETEYVTDETKGVRYDEGQDAGYPVYVAASADRGGVSDDRVQIESSKLVVVGNSEFALDAALTQQRQQSLDFLSSAMNWLLDRSQFAGVIPKTVSHFSLELTESQMSTLAFVTMIAIPGAAAFLGLIVWWRRRS